MCNAATAAGCRCCCRCLLPPAVLFYAVEKESPEDLLPLAFGWDVQASWRSRRAASLRAWWLPHVAAAVAAAAAVLTHDYQL